MKIGTGHYKKATNALTNNNQPKEKNVQTTLLFQNDILEKAKLIASQQINRSDNTPENFIAIYEETIDKLSRLLQQQQTIKLAKTVKKIRNNAKRQIKRLNEEKQDAKNDANRTNIIEDLIKRAEDRKNHALEEAMEQEALDARQMDDAFDAQFRDHFDEKIAAQVAVQAEAQSEE